MKLKMRESITVPHDIELNLVRVNERIREKLIENCFSTELQKATTHLLQNPGKLVRPSLVLTTAQVLGIPQGKYIDLASAIEMMHIASLIHDDIVDEDVMRRGVPAVHVQFGKNLAVLAGDRLIADAIDLASSYGEEVVRSAARASRAMTEGESLDIRYQQAGDLTQVAYLKVAELKTATLLGVSASIVATHVAHEYERPLYEFGFNVGIAFQLRDDILNYLGLNDKGIKPTGTDLLRSRPNIVGVLFSEKVNDAVNEAFSLQGSYLDKAQAALEGVENSEVLRESSEFLRLEVEV